MKYIWILLLLAGVANASQPVQVIGVGATPAEAKRDAFKQASETVCKNTVFSRRESRNDKITLDDVAIANGCHIDKHKLIDSRVKNGSYVSVYEVWVTDSDLSNGLKSQHNNPRVFEGTLHKDQLDTYATSVQSQLDLVDRVFSYYPYHAFDVSYGSYRLFINKQNQLTFVLSYSIKWNDNFLHSVASLLETTHDSRGGLSTIGNANVVIMPTYDTMVLSALVNNNRTHYIFDNHYVMDRIRHDMVKDNYAFARVRFFDKDGNVIQQYCQDITAPMYTFEHSGFIHFFYKQEEKNIFNLEINVPVEQIHEFSVDVAKSIECNN
jgi:hypothetical protein